MTIRSDQSTDLFDGAGGVHSACPSCAPITLGTETWEDLHTRHHEARAEIDRLRGELVQAKFGLASFENLFRISPISIMEQDYTRVEEWMEGLRAEGVTDIRKHLGDDIEAIRKVIPLIWIVAANPAAVEAVGLPLDDLVGPIDPSIANEESMPSWLSQLEAVWKRQPEAHAAYVASTPDGRRYDAESTLVAPVIDGQPDFSRAVFTLIDVTAHRSEERRMEELIEAKNRFLASVSHEIRTPLTAIVGFGKLLQGDDLMDEKERRLMVTSLVQQAQEVSDIVEDLLAAARAQAGQVNVDSVVFDVIEQVHRILAAGGSFTTDVDVVSSTDEVQAVGDPARVRQVLRNLLTNAERYGGPEVAVSVEVDGSWVHVDVIDNGAGLPPDEWEPIFELYHRAHHQKSRPESVGIGLAVSRQLADLMGGSLTYSRRADRSVFRLTLQSPA